MKANDRRLKILFLRILAWPMLTLVLDREEIGFSEVFVIDKSTFIDQFEATTLMIINRFKEIPPYNRSNRFNEVICYYFIDR